MGPDRSSVAKTQAQQRLQSRDFRSILVVSTHSPATALASPFLPTRLFILTYFIPTAQSHLPGAYGSITHVVVLITSRVRSTASRRIGLQQGDMALPGL
jgi:hypothetical protein